MNKIINWVGGSFFRTIGRLLVYILLGYILALLLSENNIKLPIFQVLDVHALGNDSWFNHIQHYGSTSTYFYNHTSTTAYSEVSGYIDYRDLYFQDTNINDDPIIKSYNFPAVSNANIANNGFSISFYLTELLAQGYLYNITSYFCFSASVSSIEGSLSTGYSATNAINHSMGYHITVKQSLATVSAPSSTDNLSNCYAFTSLISSTGTYQWANMKFTNSSNLQRSIILVGYDIEALGIYNASLQQYVQNAINNSGLASASSITQVQSSVNQVKQELSNVDNSIQAQTEQQQQNHEETIDTITDDSINENGVSDFTSGLNKEYSSLTPFSDFLNLPLTWIQSLFASNQNCTTIHLPLPYLNNKYLDLPCMTQFWQQMGAIGTLVQVVWIAIVGVRIFNGLFLLTCETIDPNPDKDMTKLRTWEL